MLNKFFIFYLIIFNLFFLNCFGNEQITFDVNEIEIIDGGNKIIGKNKGIINTNNGITIEANEFEFDKKKNILNAQGNITIKDLVNNYSFTGQYISYFINEERIEINGKSEALVNTNLKFNSENITILRNDMMISSDVGVTILDNKNLTR